VISDGCQMIDLIPGRGRETVRNISQKWAPRGRFYPRGSLRCARSRMARIDTLNGTTSGAQTTLRMGLGYAARRARR
jgi:hypothetical protein